MKRLAAICLLALACGINPASAEMMPFVEDNFNSYASGPVIGQSAWESYANGSNFIVQDAVVFEGAKALRVRYNVDSVIGKSGPLLTNGRQEVRVRSENRGVWKYYYDGNVQVRMTSGLWGAAGDSFISVTFKGDGNVAYYDPVSLAYQNFAVYNDNEWTHLETEWRSSDTSARYRVNSGAWTDWVPFSHEEPFTGFNYVGFGFFRGGNGGACFDTLEVPEPATLSILASGFLAAIAFFLRRK